jgi:hypothetical protein
MQVSKQDAAYTGRVSSGTGAGPSPRERGGG